MISRSTCRWLQYLFHHDHFAGMADSANLSFVKIDARRHGLAFVVCTVPLVGMCAGIQIS